MGQRNRSSGHLFAASLTLGIAAMDLLLKGLVAGSFTLGERVEVVPGFFAITYIRNPGMAFGLLSEWNSWLRTPLLLIATVGALGFILYLYLTLSIDSKFGRVALPFIAGGALANFYERLTAGARGGLSRFLRS